MKSTLMIALMATTFTFSFAQAAGKNKRNPTAELNCNVASTAAGESLNQTMKTDPFVVAVMNAEKARLPQSWKCDDVATVEPWSVKKKGGGVEARAYFTCSGPEQHVNIEFVGSVSMNDKGACAAQVSSFKESLGD